METSTLIKDTRSQLQLTQKELSKLLKRKQSTIARYESGGITPPGDIVLKIQQLLKNKGDGTQR